MTAIPVQSLDQKSAQEELARLAETLAKVDQGDLHFLYDHDTSEFPEDDPEMEPERKPPDMEQRTNNTSSDALREINGHIINKREPDYKALS